MAYKSGSRECHAFWAPRTDRTGAFLDIFASLLSHLAMIANMYSKLSFYTLSEKYVHKLKRNNGYSWYQDESFGNRLPNPENEMTFRVPMVKFQNSRMNSVVGSNKRQTPSNLLWKGRHVSPSIHVNCPVVSTSLRDQCDRKLVPRHSMYRLFTYICLKTQPNVGKYGIHWVFGVDPAS